MPYMVSQWKIPWHGSCDGRLSVILWCDQWKRTRYGRPEFCRKVSASFSIFSVQWISSGDAVKLLMESMRSHCILPAVMWQRESIIIIPMKTIRSAQWICTEKIWTARLWSVIRWFREKKSISRTDDQRMKEGRLDEKESPSGRSQFQFNKKAKNKKRGAFSRGTSFLGENIW